MATELKELGFAKIYVLKGGWRQWVSAQYPIEAKDKLVRDCVTCHSGVTPNIVSDWKLSKHSVSMVSCQVCHGDAHHSAADTEKTLIPTIDTCAKCHGAPARQFREGKHAKAWAAMKAMPTAHRQPMALMEGMKGCGGCHKLGLKTDAEIRELRKQGRGFGNASCDACHTRHIFSLKEAREPQACQTCHMGFDHPQWEMYSSSKHGVRYLLKQNGVLPDSVSAPTCQTCHMRGGNHAVRTAWGFLAVRLPLPEDKKWSADRATILQGLGVLDPQGKPTARFDVVKAADVARLTQEDWQQERDKMFATCRQCHSGNFARAELDKGDQMIREADGMMAEAIRVVAGLYRDGILKQPKGYAYRFPDLLAFHDAPTSIEQDLYLMFSEYRMRTFMGTFHANPDYAFWYGWAEMRRSLTEVKEKEKELRKAQGKRKR
ncbi:MAG TPA: multiheme c-type cytochrome [Syntrophales bacterium]|nr:multiheme c-type cytochrome [Syntrophales bacterium]HOX94781.1 multiheme c-type cytochrome [Syntrophales bacterium]HPI57298.1 multiheme c-type cytochrome [Syntrophales bacterium]HPN25178.1 multiheme c-type cytochrome [Syntrophales bacterium]HQM29403.1 multiheme c-type cytochrome [Syntrophales bacterium]